MGADPSGFLLGLLVGGCMVWLASPRSEAAAARAVLVRSAERLGRSSRAPRSRADGARR